MEREGGMGFRANTLSDYSEDQALSWGRREVRPQRGWRTIQMWKVSGLENWEGYFNTLQFQM